MRTATMSLTDGTGFWAAGCIWWIQAQELIQYRAKYFPAGQDPKLLALGLSSRKNLCINEKVNGTFLKNPKLPLIPQSPLCQQHQHALYTLAQVV